MKNIEPGRKKKWASGILIAGALFCVDQSIKHFFSGSARRYCNPDGLWGTVSHEGLFISGGAVILIVFGVLLLRAKTWKEIVAYALLFGGGLSNLLDRVAYGCVRDFTIISWFPAFNLADICLSIGTVILLVSLFEENKNTPGR